MNAPQVSFYTEKHLTNPVLDSAFSSGSQCVQGSPRDFLSLSSVIIPFPPHERKDRNNPTEIYGSPGAKLLCRSKWKTRAAVAGTLRDLEFHGPMGFGPWTWTRLMICAGCMEINREVACETLSVYDSWGKL